MSVSVPEETSQVAEVIRQVLEPGIMDDCPVDVFMPAYPGEDVMWALHWAGFRGIVWRDRELPKFADHILADMDWPGSDPSYEGEFPGWIDREKAFQEYQERDDAAEVWAAMLPTVRTEDQLRKAVDMVASAREDYGLRMAHPLALTVDVSALQPDQVSYWLGWKGFDALALTTRSGGRLESARQWVKLARDLDRRVIYRKCHTRSRVMHAHGIGVDATVTGAAFKATEATRELCRTYRHLARHQW